MSSILNFSILKNTKTKKTQSKNKKHKTALSPFYYLESLKRLSNQNSKSYFFSNPTDQSKEGRSIRSKEQK